MKYYSTLFLFFLILANGHSQLALEFDINQDAAGAQITEGVVLDHWLVFSADDGIHGREPWVIDLASGQGKLISDLAPFASSSFPQYFVPLDDKVYFTAKADGRNIRLWSYHPESETAEMVMDQDFILNGGEVFAIDTFQSQIVMGYEMNRTEGTELYIYDPVNNAVQLIEDIDPDGASSPSAFLSHEGILYFAATSGATGNEVWQYNPANGEVMVLTDTDAGPTGKSVRFITAFDGQLYFSGFEQGKGTELFAYNLTSGEVVVSDLFIGPGSSDPFDFTLYNNELYFRARPNSGRKMMKVSPGGSITEIGDLDIQEIAVFQGNLLVTGRDDSNLLEFYQYNDQSEDYTKLPDVAPNNEGINIYGLLESAEHLYFVANPPEYDAEWFYYDGSNPGELLYDVNQTTIGSSPFDFTPFDGKLYFSAENNIVNRETWVYDPATGTTSLLEDLQPGLGDSQPFSYISYQNRLYFGAKFEDLDHELVAYDPQTDMIELVADINPGSSGSYLEYPAVFQDMLFFSAQTETNGNELFMYNGTTDQLSLVAEIAAGDEDAYPQELTVYHDKLYFSANDRVNGTELWVLDNVNATPRMVLNIDESSGSSGPEDLLVYHDKLFFTARDVNGNVKFMSYDDGTDEVTIYDGPTNVQLRYPTVHNDKIYGQYRISGIGQELYAFDDATGEWELAADIYSGSSSSNPEYLVSYNGYLYFSAEEPTYGRELYEYNDTTGTFRIYADIWQGGFSSSPRQMTNFNGKMYFAANNGDKGEEIWSLAPCINAFVTTTPDYDQLSNGTASITIEGGSSPYTVLWDNGIMTTEANGLTAGSYQVEITDALGCKTSLTIVISAIDTDFDNDGVINEEDNCPNTANPDQEDNDNDGTGDVCDDDDDNDGVLDENDNCPLMANAEQNDNDSDGIGDLCDDDDDNDSVADVEDNCPLMANPDQNDNDGDGMGDLCDDNDDGDNIPDVDDNCPFDTNFSQSDQDEDGLGDVCDDDDDNDSVSDTEDNCLTIMNPDQNDNDEDGIGDLCDEDDDNDSILDEVDNCPFVFNPGQEDSNNNGVGDACATSAVDDRFSSQISLFPNPNDGSFHLTLPAQVRSADIHIFDALGRRIRAIDFNGTTSMVTISDLSSGQYTVMILELDNGKVGVKRVSVVE